MKAKKKVDPLLRKLQQRRDAIAKERDGLRVLLDEFNEIEDISGEALEALDSAIQTLSGQL